jgi:hypothetical protein
MRYVMPQTGRYASWWGVGAHHVGQQVPVGAVALGAEHAVPLPIPRCLQGVHREHGVKPH